MLNAETEFNLRTSEIDEYIKYVEVIEKSTGFSVTLINTMKSSALLMLYNLVESTMTNLMQDIFDHLKAKAIGFDGLSDAMKEVVLNYSKRRNPSKLVKKMSDDAVGIVVACFDRSDIFSGNVDSRKIAETIKEFGVKTSVRYKEEALLTVKTERNSLAHGSKSFSECGKGYTGKDLRAHYDKVTLVLNKVIKDFENFLTTSAYV